MNATKPTTDLWQIMKYIQCFKCNNIHTWPVMFPKTLSLPGCVMHPQTQKLSLLANLIYNFSEYYMYSWPNISSFWPVTIYTHLILSQVYYFSLENLLYPSNRKQFHHTRLSMSVSHPKQIPEVEKNLRHSTVDMILWAVCGFGSTFCTAPNHSQHTC